MEAIKEFCKEIEAVKYFSNDEAALKRLGVEYKIFEARDAALNAVWDAAWSAAWCAACKAARDAVRDAARDIAGNAAWCAAREAAREAARKTARNAAGSVAWDAAGNAAQDAAWSAALQCCMTTVCKDLDIPQEHRDYASQEWGIWKAGYGVLGKVENIFYLYEKP